MACHNCNNPNTIKAHLVPRVFCREVQSGTSHALHDPSRSHFTKSQSGVWDDSILCSKCDNTLGVYENYAHKMLSMIRTSKIGSSGQILTIGDVDRDSIMRFLAGILYKFSLTTRVILRINLGRYQEVCRAISLANAPIPPCLEVLAFRPILFAGDDSVIAYRTPSPDRKYGLNIYRMMIGGMVFLIKLDKRKIESTPLIKDFKMLIGDNDREFSYAVAKAEFFEDCYLPAISILQNQQLSQYLDNVSPKPPSQ